MPEVQISGVHSGSYKEAILFLVTAGIVVPLFHRLRISPVLGFIGAGALLGPVYVVFPQMGGLAELKAFAIVILGGLGNVTGAAIGGFVLALAEEFGAGYVSSGYRDAMGFLIIIAVLLYKPTGLFAKAERIG